MLVGEARATREAMAEEMVSLAEARAQAEAEHAQLQQQREQAEADRRALEESMQGLRAMREELEREVKEQLLVPSASPSPSPSPRGAGLAVQLKLTACPTPPLALRPPGLGIVRNLRECRRRRRGQADRPGGGGTSRAARAGVCGGR